MTITEPSTGSRHLVDPEIAPVLEALPGFELTSEALPGIREASGAVVEGAPDPDELFPGVAATTKSIPGYEGDPDVRVLWYEPRQRTGESPALVWIHGGGYVLGTADIDDLLCRRIVAETGACVASVDYRLAPETPAPGLVHDCYAALTWVHGSADELGVDASRIAVGGASAGGGLAATLAILARDKGEVPVTFQLLVYPMLDDRTASTVPPHPFAGEFVWTAQNNVFGWQSLLGTAPGGEGVSPYSAAARVESVEGLPPTFIAVGALDLFAEEDIAYATRLIRAGIPTELHVYPGAFHAFDMLPTARVAQQFSRDMLTALGRALNG